MLTVAYELISLSEMYRYVREKKSVTLLTEKWPVLRDLVVTISIAVVILYWTLDRSGDLFSAILYHGVSTALIVAEVCILKQSYVPTLHSARFYIPIIFALTYIIFEASISFLGVTDHGSPLYTALPWTTDPMTALKWSIVGVLLVAFIPIMRKSINFFAKRL